METYSYFLSISLINLFLFPYLLYSLFHIVKTVLCYGDSPDGGSHHIRWWGTHIKTEYCIRLFEAAIDAAHLNLTTYY